MKNDFGHTPVLLEEAVKSLNVIKDKWYVDGTIGGGGHAEEVLKKEGNVLGIDQDQDSISYLRKKFENNGSIILENGNFSDIKKIVKKHKIKVSGILFDLGLSSHQIEKSGRGFSFRKSEALEDRKSVV